MDAETARRAVPDAVWLNVVFAELEPAQLVALRAVNTSFKALASDDGRVACAS